MRLGEAQSRFVTIRDRAVQRCIEEEHGTEEDDDETA